MRKSSTVTIPAGKSWPACAGGVGAILTRYSWLRIQNRGAAGGDVVFATGGSPPTSDSMTWEDKVLAGATGLWNFGTKEDEVDDDLPNELQITNVSATVDTVVRFTIADSPITASTSGGATTGGGDPTVVAITAGGTLNNGQAVLGVGVATVIRPASTARYSVLVGNPSTAGAAIFLGPAGVGATGFRLDPGQSLEFRTTAAIYGYSAAGETVNWLEESA